MKIIKVKEEAVQLQKQQKVVGAKMIDTDTGEKVVVAIQEGANTLIRIMDALEDVIEEIIEKGTPLYYRIKSFFDDIFNYLPTFIEKDGKRYRLTLQPARGHETDYVSYMSGAGELLFVTMANNMFEAKKKMHKLLEGEELI